MPINNGTLFIVDRVQVFLRHHRVNESPPSGRVQRGKSICHPHVSFLAVASVELLDSSGGINNLGLACVEAVSYTHLTLPTKRIV